MDLSLSTHQHLKESIALKLAEVANDSVSQFFDKGGSVDKKQIPLMYFLKAAKGKKDSALCDLLREQFPWLSATDLALAEFRVGRESRVERVAREFFASEVAEDWALIESNLEAIHHIPMNHYSHEEAPIFVRILQALDPFTLHELEKFLRWKGGEEVEQKLQAIEDVWRDLCLKHDINLLRNQDPASGTPYPWKAYFIARYFKRCNQQMGKERDTLKTLLSLSLLFDNQALLKKSNLIQLADLETDTL